MILNDLEDLLPGLSFTANHTSTSLTLTAVGFPGDANLDGHVDVTDLGALATNWQTSSNWLGGDFNYDNFVDVTDLGALATNWQAGVGNPLGPDSLQSALAAVGLSPVSIPEPTVVALLACTVLARRKRISHRS
jgi:hypothetical protein